MGPSFPLGEFKDAEVWPTEGEDLRIGVNINLLNFGYLFTNNFGVTASWLGTAYYFDENPGYARDGYWGYGALLAGPMYSVKLGKRSRMEFKGMLGYMQLNLKFHEDKSFSHTSDGICYGIDVSYRYFFAKKWLLLLAGQLIRSPNQGVSYLSYFYDEVESLNTSVGVAFSFGSLPEK